MDIYEIRKANLIALIGSQVKRECAERWDMAPAHLSQVLSDRTHKNLGDDVARRIEEREGLPRAWLDTLRDSAGIYAKSAESAQKEIRKGVSCEIDIPQFDVRAAMGSGQLPSDYAEIIRHVTMHRAHMDLLGITYTSAENLAIITGWGQSMAGTISHGEPVFVDRGVTQFIGDGVYVFTWDDLLYIKRVQKVSKTHFRIISDNREHDPFDVKIEDVIFHAQALLAWNAKRL